jgi:hypothetical protein
MLYNSHNSITDPCEHVPYPPLGFYKQGIIPAITELPSLAQTGSMFSSAERKFMSSGTDKAPHGTTQTYRN